MPQNRDHWQTPMNLVMKLAGNFFDKLNTKKKPMWGSYVIKSKRPVFFLFVIFHSSRLMCIYCKYNKISLIRHLKIWKC